MNRYWIILVLIFFSCSKDAKIKSELFEVTYTERIPKEKAELVSNYIDVRQKESHFLDRVSKIKIDSSYYSYQLYLSGDSLADKPNLFQVFAKFISDDILDSVDVHVFVTDDSFSKIEQGYRFTPGSVIYGRQEGVSKYAKISIPAEMSTHIPRALVDELRVNKPELFATTDTLEINIDYKKDDVIVDIYARIDKINIDTLKRQFKDAYCASLIYDIMFAYTPTYINIRDKNTRKVQFVSAHGTQH